MALFLILLMGNTNSDVRFGFLTQTLLIFKPIFKFARCLQSPLSLNTMFCSTLSLPLLVEGKEGVYQALVLDLGDGLRQF